MERERDSKYLVLVNETSETKVLPLLRPIDAGGDGAGAAPAVTGAVKSERYTRPTRTLSRILSGTSSEPAQPAVAASGNPGEHLTIPAGRGLRITRETLDLYDYRALAESGEISLVRATDPVEIDAHRLVSNKTARHIRIRNRTDAQPEELVINPFGRRRVRLSVLQRLDLDSWLKLNLIKVSEPRPPRKSTWEWWAFPGATIVYGWLGILFLPHSIDLSSIGVGVISRWWLWPAATAVIGTLSFVSLSHKGASVRSVTVQAVNLILLLLVGPVGLPILVALFFGGVFAQPPPGEAVATGIALPFKLAAPSVELLGRGVQTVLIILLSALPGLLYFQFERRQINVVRTRFIRDIILLNPSIQTVDDAVVTHGRMVDEVSGAIGANSNQFAVFSSGRPILIATLLITVGWITALWPVGPLSAIDDVHSLLLPHTSPMIFAFLGAYFFGINLIFRRYARGDLTPKAYSHVMVRILSAVIVVWVVSSAVPSSSTADAILLVAAFGIGIIPESGVALLKDLVSKSRLGRRFPSVAVSHPITDLDGVSLYDQARLLEEGVETVENLAHSNLIEVMLRSGIPTARLVDLVDQSILYLHVSRIATRGQTDEEARRSRNGMRMLQEAGIRTATDLLRVVELADERVSMAASAAVVNRKRLQALETERDRLFQLLEDESDGGPNKVRLVLDALADDEWLEYVRNWRSLCRARSVVSDPEEFYRPEKALTGVRHGAPAA